MDLKRAVWSRVLLGLGVGVALRTAIWLARLGRVPERWAIPSFLLVLALLICVAAGWLSNAGSSLAKTASPRPLTPGFPAARLLAAAAALGAFAWVWVLQIRPDPPLKALLIWIAGMVAVVAAFPRASKAASASATPARRGLPLAVAAVVMLAAGARLIRLDLVLPVLSGDEASVAMDGRGILDRSDGSDPFGSGVNSSMHIGMMPAGAGAILFDSKLGGPRLFPAIIGVLAVAVTAGAAALLAGPWAALGAAALIALNPLHVHFSRSSNNVVVDSLTVTAAVLFLFAALKTGSPRSACLAGVCSGIALYGYGGGRIMPVVLLASLPMVLWRFRGHRRRQALLAGALIAGFLIAAGPNLHYAMLRFDEWNGRFNRTSVFEPRWNRQEVKIQGSETKVLLNQFRLGTIGLLSSGPTIDIFTGVPMIAPALLPALGIAGLGWLFGRRRSFAEALLAALVVGGNLAGVSLTLSTPQPQRVSSLVPMLAILGGVALAGFLALFPERAGGAPLKSALGALFVGVFLARQVSGYPLDWLPYAEGGGRHAAMAQSVCGLLSAPRYRDEPIYFHGSPFVYWDFPSFRYFMPGRKVTMMADEDPYSVPPGVHVFSEEYLEKAKSWAREMEIPHPIRLPHPAFVRQDIALVVLLRTTTPPYVPESP
ncbi:MAG: glycosyltransferase family 39 protein [Acidobacteriota bacterium]